MDNFSDWSPARAAEIMTPRFAATVKWRVLQLRCATDPESLAQTDPITDNYGPHRWFVYCMDTVARRA